MLPPGLKIVPRSVYNTPNTPEAGTGTNSFGPAPGTAQPDSPVGGQYTCVDAGDSAAGQANSFIIGTCFQGTEFDATSTTGTSRGTYYGGYIAGDFSGCGWLRSQYLGNYTNQNHTGCADGTTALNRPECSYIYCDGSGNEYVFGSANDGASLDVTQACPEFGQFRPWSATPSYADYVGAVNPGDHGKGGPTDYNLRVRYLAKTPQNGVYFYLAHDISRGERNTNWVFVGANCFQ